MNSEPPPAPAAWGSTAPKAGGTPKAVRVVLGVIVAVVLIALMLRGPGRADAPRSVVTASGAGIMDSAPMSMSGTYEVTWTATGTANGCYHGANLRTTADKRAAELVALEVTGSQTGTVWVYSLARGTYFVSASSGCNPWSFSFSPRN